jgi:hypothetical protein
MRYGFFFFLTIVAEALEYTYVKKTDIWAFGPHFFCNALPFSSSLP